LRLTVALKRQSFTKQNVMTEHRLSKNKHISGFKTLAEEIYGKTAARAALIADKSFLGLLLLGAGAGALIFQPRYDVGFFNDDASFVLLARSILDYLRMPAGPGFLSNFTHFMPGYPVFLAPFAAVFEPHWAWLRLTTAAVSVLSLYGVWKLSEGWMTAEERRWATLLYALHPLFLLSSGMVMADPFLSCLFIFGLLGLRWAVEGVNGGWAYALLICMAVWAAGTKPIGIILALALTVSLLTARAWKALGLTTAFIWLPALLAGLSAFLKKESPTDYIYQMTNGLAHLAQQPFLERIYNSLHTFVLVYGLALPWPRGPVFDLLGALMIAGILYFCATGLSSLLSKPRPGRFVALAAGILILCQALIMSLWSVYSQRYALPILPFMLLFLVAGLYSFAESRAKAAKGLLVLLALGFLIRSAGLALETYSPQRPAETKLCLQTLEWIRTETPPESRFLGRGAAILLYTGRAGHGMFGAPNMDAFISELSRLHITHALVTDETALSPRGAYRTNQAWQKMMERAWLQQHPRFFKKLHENKAEKTEIYSIGIPERWDNAVALYGRALRELRDSDRTAATASLRQALAEVPDFPSALTALASVRLWQGKDFKEAEKHLRHALALEPNYARASQMLLEILERQGRKSEAAKVRASGQAAVSLPPFEVIP